jgi:hypothetical protein
MERASRFQGLLYTSQIPYKITLNKENFPSLKGASLNVPQKGAPLETAAHFQSRT